MYDTLVKLKQMHSLYYKYHIHRLKPKMLILSISFYPQCVTDNDVTRGGTTIFFRIKIYAGTVFEHHQLNFKKVCTNKCVNGVIVVKNVSLLNRHCSSATLWSCASPFDFNVHVKSFESTRTTHNFWYASFYVLELICYAHFEYTFCTQYHVQATLWIYDIVFLLAYIMI